MTSCSTLADHILTSPTSPTQSSYIAHYRKYQGKATFMGVVERITSTSGNAPSETEKGSEENERKILIKLDNPLGPLSGPGHVMSAYEFDSECSHYDDAPCVLQQEFAYKHVPLVSFQAKPGGFRDSQGDFFDVKFPFQDSDADDDLKENCVPQDSPPLVRADDYVKVVAFQRGSPIVCRFWVDVISVTSMGIITGLSCADLIHFGIADGDLLAFDIKKVLGVRHGKNWHRSETNN